VIKRKQKEKEAGKGLPYQRRYHHAKDRRGKVKSKIDHKKRKDVKQKE